jgi:hypothetical protein
MRRRAATACVSFAVSFTAVQTGAGGYVRAAATNQRAQPNRAERTSADLESVLGATPQEFESLILRSSDQGKRRSVTDGAPGPRPGGLS